jgi:hypothetical protein
MTGAKTAAPIEKGSIPVGLTEELEARGEDAKELPTPAKAPDVSTPKEGEEK